MSSQNNNNNAERRGMGRATIIVMILTVISLLVLFEMIGENTNLMVSTTMYLSSIMYESYIEKPLPNTIPNTNITLHHDFDHDDDPFTPAPIIIDQPIPDAYIYTKELYNNTQPMFRNSTNTTIIMLPEVFEQLANRIRRIKHTRKPLLIMINSHPCAGKSYFISKKTDKVFMGCKLMDHDNLANRFKHDSSYLMRLHKENEMKGMVTRNTALLGSSLSSSKQENFYDVIYISVIPPLTITKHNVQQRQKEGNRPGIWSRLEEVTNRRRLALLYAIKDEVLVEPLFPTFQEGLEFCINTYNTYNNNTDDIWVDDPEEPPMSEKQLLRLNPPPKKKLTRREKRAKHAQQQQKRQNKAKAKLIKADKEKVDAKRAEEKERQENKAGEQNSQNQTHNGWEGEG